MTRLWEGFTFQDPATRLRLSEYENAWHIIQRHPWFGIGFGDAGSIELQAGVSSTYLTIAERAGLVGLAVFLLTVGVIVVRGLRAGVSRSSGVVGDTALCWVGALVAALTVGVVDHYFFNPPFAHMAALFWLIAGVVTRLSFPIVEHQRTVRDELRGLSSASSRFQREPQRFQTVVRRIERINV